MADDTRLNTAQLYYYRARYYSPRLGRFLQTDPVGLRDDMNLYSYATTDSINNVDPNGTTVRIVTRNGGNIGQYMRARSYTGSSPTSISNRTRLIESKQAYTIVVDPQGVPGYDPETNTVTFNPNSAMKVSAGIQSAALGLEHEIAHAAHHDRIGTDKYLEGEKPPIDVNIEATSTDGDIPLDENFSISTKVGVSPNEKIATEAEKAVSAELGGSDPARDSYNESSMGDQVQVEDPTWHCRNPNCPGDK